MSSVCKFPVYRLDGTLDMAMEGPGSCAIEPQMPAKSWLRSFLRNLEEKDEFEDQKRRSSKWQFS